ncbi:uncharacterized protein LOC128993117 [Macrosteles quadrilineatus]|uniref:uncharacterized protein LOC128993117 n=1 Tax=Macrosteles quadrilineatus TaxID=74068 RepID=UPI0023E16B47|nr:uncharacterized protein LOC128993117 [Macrosteles quadrilineatus]
MFDWFCVVIGGVVFIVLCSFVSGFLAIAQMCSFPRPIKAVSTTTAGPGGLVIIHTEEEKRFVFVKESSDFFAPEIPPNIVHVPVFPTGVIKPSSSEASTNTEVPNKVCSSCQTSPPKQGHPPPSSSSSPSTGPTPSNPSTSPPPGSNPSSPCTSPPQGSTPPNPSKPSPSKPPSNPCTSRSPGTNPSNYQGQGSGKSQPPAQPKKKTRQKKAIKKQQ